MKARDLATSCWRTFFRCERAYVLAFEWDASV